MIVKRYEIICDECGKGISIVNKNKRQAVVYAKANGWYTRAGKPWEIKQYCSDECNPNQ